MGSEHRMRCLMWTFSMHIDFLATGLMLQYSFAHGNETEGVQSPLAGGLHRNPVNERLVGLCQLSGIEAGEANVRGRASAVYGACAGSEEGISRRVLQWMGERCHSDGRRKRGLTVDGRCAPESRGTHVHVFDRWSAMAHSTSGRRLCDGRFRADQRGRDCTVGR